MRKICILKFMLLIIPFTWACGITSLFNTFKPEKLDFPKATYSEIGWLNGELIAFVSEPSLMTELRYTKEKNINFYSIFLEKDISCTKSTQYKIGDILGNDLIQINKQCFSEPESSEYFLLYNLNDQSIKRAFGPLPLGSNSIVWESKMNQGLVLLADAFAKSTLYLITQQDYTALNIVISDEGKSWNFSNFFPDFPDIEATTGNIGSADWSSDGKFVAFFASPDSVGKVGFDRMYARYKMYIMEFDNPNPTPVLDEIFFPANIKWSPDKNYIAFTGHYQDSSEALWLYSFNDASATLIDEGDFRDILWSPDSNSLIAIKCNGLFKCTSTDIVKYNLSNN